MSLKHIAISVTAVHKLNTSKKGEGGGLKVKHSFQQYLWPWFPRGSSCSAEHKGWAHEGGVCLGPWHVWVPVRVLCTEVTCRDPTLVSVSVKSVPDAQSLSQAGTPGTPMISGWGECVVCARSMAGRCVHYCGWDEMAFRRWRHSLHGPRPEAGDGVSTAAPREPGKGRNLVWVPTWNRSYEGKKSCCLFRCFFFFTWM